MPARKPSALNHRHNTKADRASRVAGETSVMPKTLLQKRPPSALNGHDHAKSVWRWLVRLYAETQGTIVTAFDEPLLIKYCLADEELLELSDLRSETLKLWKKHVKILEAMDVSPDNLKSYFGALSQANALNQRYQSMDARLDNKRKYLHTLSQSLYLTPRSRAGVAPQEKDHDDEPQDDMEKLLNE